MNDNICMKYINHFLLGFDTKFYYLSICISESLLISKLILESTDS